MFLTRCRLLKPLKLDIIQQCIGKPIENCSILTHCPFSKSSVASVVQESFKANCGSPMNRFPSLNNFPRDFLHSVGITFLDVLCKVSLLGQKPFSMDDEDGRTSAIKRLQYRCPLQRRIKRRTRRFGRQWKISSESNGHSKTNMFTSTAQSNDIEKPTKAL